MYEEVVTQGLLRGASDALVVRLFWQRRGWPIVDVPDAVLSAYHPSVILDPGETELLAWERTLADPLVLLDDEVARADARRLELPVLGTLGTIAWAFRRSLLSLDQAEMLIEEIAARPDIWIGAKLCTQVLASLRYSSSLGRQAGS